MQHGTFFPTIAYCICQMRQRYKYIDTLHRTVAHPSCWPGLLSGTIALAFHSNCKSPHLAKMNANVLEF